MSSRVNPVLWISVALPLITVAASFLTLAAAVRQPDSELPEQYHWEGMKLDRDFARAERARALGVSATLEDLGRDSACSVRLEIRETPPASVRLRLTHATQPSLDREVTFTRRGDSSIYDGQCTSMPDGHWRVELADEAGIWSIRQNVRGVLSGAQIDSGSQP